MRELENQSWQEGDFLFFRPQNAPEDEKFVAAASHSAFFRPPKLATERLGQNQTQNLLVRRARQNGTWGRLFEVEAENGTWFLMLGTKNRHLLTRRSDHENRPHADWTPFEWPVPAVETTPSSQLLARVQAAAQDPNSAFRAAMRWHQSDFRQRLWKCLGFQNGDALMLQKLLRDALQIAPLDWNAAPQWIFQFRLHDQSARHQLARPGHIADWKLEITPDLLESTQGGKRLALAPEFGEKMAELLEFFRPFPLLPSQAPDLTRREWLNQSGGLDLWSFEVAASAPSAHDKLEAMLRLRAGLRELWGEERAAKWLEAI